MRIRRTPQEIRNEIVKRYFETNISREELAREYRVCSRTVGRIIKEYRDKQKQEKENGNT